MHEYSIVQALYEKVVAEATMRRATSVHRLTVRIGELSGVDAGLLDTAWQVFRERTICAGATLEIARIAAEWECRGCGADVPRGARWRAGCAAGRRGCAAATISSWNESSWR